jgi:uncharacterized protein (UPF0333 family)
MCRTRSQTAVEFLILLAAVIIIVGGVVYFIYLASSGLGSSVENRIENAVAQVENLLKALRP